MADALRGRSLGLAVLALLLAAVSPAAAQSGFLFSRPGATATLYGGWALPGEGGDLLAFARDELTIDQGAFAAPVVMGELAVRVSERVDVAAGVEYASRTVNSEMREWVTQNDQPIPQSSRFSRTRVLGSVKAYLLPRGQQISHFAWIPNRWSPYLGGGVGVTWYRFVQDGDFVDYQTYDIFEDQLDGRGSGFTLHGLAGAQFSLSTRLLLRGEYRYIWGDAGVDGDDYVGFTEMDLSGSSFMLGVAVRL